MNDLMVVILLGVGILLIYAAIKGTNPIQEVKDTLAGRKRK